jgi:hypothetical protein
VDQVVDLIAGRAHLDGRVDKPRRPDYLFDHHPGGLGQLVVGARNRRETGTDLFIDCYCYLFIVLQLEDYALIPGSVGLLVILALVMYVTRKINWYEVETVARENEK